MAVKKVQAEIATIDVSLVTIAKEDGTEFGFDTASQVVVEAQIEEEEAQKLIIKGVLKAQKPVETTLTGNKITLTDNVFIPDLVLVLQGGTILYDAEDATKIIGYRPPVSGSKIKGEIFTLNIYSAQYDAAGLIVQYEKISYPNCKGTPFAFGSQDGVFRASEYVVNSAPKSDEPPYEIDYVPELPVLMD